MTTLTLCLGMWLSICGQIQTYDYSTPEACERARKAIPALALGHGYAICHPKKAAP
jgi:hypothetical protein